MRCFLGFELAEASRAVLRAHVEQAHALLQQALPGAWRAVHPDNWHATLLFFADLDATARGEVWQAAERAAQAGTWRELRIAWQGLVPWPNLRRPTLVCLDGGAYPQAREWPLLHRMKEEPFSRGDVDRLQSFHPHITVLRLRRKPARGALRAAWQALASLAPPPPEAIRLDRVSLFVNDLSREKPIYTREGTAPL